MLLNNTKPLNKINKMENLTIEQVKELHLLVVAMADTLTESIHGVAKVAKAIQTYLGCEFAEAVRVLGIIVNEA